MRYEAVMKNYRQGHPDYNNLSVPVLQSEVSVSQLLYLITQQLPGWQSTRFDSHMILYKEARDYMHGTVICRQPG